MAKLWQEPWTEVWSAGRGKDRSYCGIAETEEGFAVDVFHGDTCVDSSIHPNRKDAERAAQALRGRFLRTVPAYQPTSTHQSVSAQGQGH